MATNDRKHTILGEPEQPSRAALNAMLASVNDIVPVANTTDRATTAAALGPTTSRPLVVYRADAAPGHEIEITTDGSTWWVIPSTPVARGKMWRTAGGSAAMTPGTEYVVGMDAARVSGGVTFETGIDSLVVPLDGLYDLTIGLYITLNVTAVVGSWINRTRASVAAAAIAFGPHVNKTIATVDDRAAWGHQAVPLQAGDRLSLVVLSYSGSPAYFGQAEGQGSFLTLEYVGPLNGATPL